MPGRRDYGRGLRKASLPVAVVGAVLVAEVAVWLLRPDGVMTPDEVPVSRYFTAEELQRARDFREGQRLLGLAGLAAEGAVLAFLVVRPPRRALRLAETAARGRPLVAGAIVGTGLVTLLRVVPLPLEAVARERARDVGLVTQSWGGWAWDLVRAAGIGALLAAVGAALFLALMRRFPGRWWIGAAAAVVAIEVLFVWLAPVVLAPIFNRYRDLQPGPTRSDVLELARRANVDVGQVLVVDASRRTTAANAYVTGLGQTKRVVLYDTLLERFSPAQVRLVVAHELGHVKHRDVQRGMLWVALVAPAGMLVVQLLTGRLSARAGSRPGDPGSLPAFALALAVVLFAGSVIGNQLSRRVEAKADTYALEVTDEPDEFVEMEHRLSVANVSDPDPPKVWVWLFGTHPPTIERIGLAVRYERERGGD